MSAHNRGPGDPNIPRPPTSQSNRSSHSVAGIADRDDTPRPHGTTNRPLFVAAREHYTPVNPVARRNSQEPSSDDTLDTVPRTQVQPPGRSRFIEPSAFSASQPVGDWAKGVEPSDWEDDALLALKSGLYWGQQDEDVSMSNPTSTSVSREPSAPLGGNPGGRMTTRRVLKQALDVELVATRDVLESFGRLAQWFQSYALPETDDDPAWELICKFPDKLSQLTNAMKANEWDTAFIRGSHCPIPAIWTTSPPA